MVINDKFKPLFKSDPNVRYTIITGGRGSSKSFSVSTFLTALTFERGHNILYTRYTMSSAHLSIIPEFLSKIDLMKQEKNFGVNKTDIVNNLTGDRILFRGIRTSSGTQTAALKSLQGITTWVVDEAEELVDEDTFDKIDLSIRQQDIHNRVILILNPATKEHWIYKRFFEDRGVNDGFNGTKGDTCYIHTDYRDNEANLSKSFLDSVARMKLERPEKYKHQMLGGWMNKAEGVIFENWVLGHFDETIIPVFGQDFGFSVDPTVLVETAIDKARKKIYIREHFGAIGMSTTDIKTKNAIYAKQKLIIADSADPRLITALQLELNLEGAYKPPGSVLSGITMMLDYDLIIEPNSTELIKELNNYAWNDRKSGTPMDKWNHYIDAARYAINYQLSNPNQGTYHIY